MIAEFKYSSFGVRKSFLHAYVGCKHWYLLEPENTFTQVKLAHDVVMHLDHLDEVCPAPQPVNDTMVSECDFAKVVDLRRNVVCTFNSCNRVLSFEFYCLDSVCACRTDFLTPDGVS